MTKEYEINEEDIGKVLNFLQLSDPDHANRDMAIAILDYMYSSMDQMSFDDPESLDKVIQDMKNHKKYS
jgi:hypothetical protein